MSNLSDINLSNITNFLQNVTNLNFIHINDREYIYRQMLTYICPECKVERTKLANQGERYFNSTYYKVCAECKVKFTHLICLSLYKLKLMDSNLLDIISSFKGN